MPRKHVNAKKTRVDGHTFPSKFEAERYVYLKLQQQRGLIQDLQLQPRFLLQSQDHTIKIKHLKADRVRHYTADFAYYENGHYVVEETKGRMMPLASFTISTFKALYPNIDFRLIMQKTKRKKHARNKKRKKTNNNSKVKILK